MLTDNIDDVSEATVLIIGEIKGSRAARIEWKFGSRLDTYEMKRRWLALVQDDLRTEGKTNAASLIQRALDGDIETKYIGGFADDLGNVYIQPLNID